MKSIRWFLFLLFFTPISVFASTNTFTRTAEDPLVPKDVIVDSTNIDSVLKTPAVSSSEKIYDYADLLSDSQEKLLFKQIDEYMDSSGVDCVVVTTNDLNGFELKDYTENFYDYNDFMIEGVIFVIYLAPDEPHIYMGTNGDPTGKAQSIYTNDRVSQILKYIYKDIKKGDYYSASRDYVKILQGFYNSDMGRDYEVNEEGNVVRQLPWVEMVILSVASSFIVIMLLAYQIKGNNRISYKDELSSRINEKTMMFRTESDNYVGSSILQKK